MQKVKADYVITVLGVLLLGVGLYLIKCIDSPQGFMRAFPYVCLGIGCGTLGDGMGSIISRKTIQTDPKIEKQFEVEKKDERNIAIGQRAKAKAFDLMTLVYGALMMAFALIGVDMIAVLLLVFVYLFVQGYAIYFRCKYDKEM